MHLVSVICSIYNSERYIRDTINSVKYQSYDNWELLITDDCSTDNSYSIIKEEAAKDHRIKIFRLSRNSGPDYGRNNSIEHASGRFIAFLDADDIWLPNKLECQVRFMTENDVDLSYSSYYIVDENGKRTGKLIKAKPNLTYQNLLNNSYIGCLTAAYDTKRIGKVYMPQIKKRQDWALWLKISKMTDKVRGISEPLAEYRITKNSISRNKFKLLRYNWRVYRDIEKFSIFRSSVMIVRFLVYYVVKKVT